LNPCGSCKGCSAPLKIETSRFPKRQLDALSSRLLCGHFSKVARYLEIRDESRLQQRLLDAFEVEIGELRSCRIVTAKVARRLRSRGLLRQRTSGGSMP